MNALLKTVFLLGLAALLLFVPLTATADDSVQDPPSVTLAAASTSVSLNAPDSARRAVQLPAKAAVPTTAFHASRVQTERFTPQDGRSTLLALCLLRC
jgi:hypothetical protein